MRCRVLSPLGRGGEIIPAGEVVDLPAHLYADLLALGAVGPEDAEVPGEAPAIEPQAQLDPELAAAIAAENTKPPAPASEDAADARVAEIDVIATKKDAIAFAELHEIVGLDETMKLRDMKALLVSSLADTKPPAPASEDAPHS